MSAQTWRGGIKVLSRPEYIEAKLNGKLYMLPYPATVNITGVQNLTYMSQLLFMIMNHDQFGIRMLSPFVPTIMTNAGLCFPAQHPPNWLAHAGHRTQHSVAVFVFSLHTLHMPGLTDSSG